MKKCWLNGKRVVITGASGGLGFNIAKILVEKYGAYVIGIARNEQKMINSLSKIKENRGNFSYRIFDVRNKGKWMEFYNELNDNNISVDVLINNAGFMLAFDKFGRATDEQIDEIIDTNLKANLFSVNLFLPLLLKSKNAHLVNICSASSMCPVVGQTLYTTTKYAMRGFTDTLRVEYKGKLKVTGIYPGFIKTDILKRQIVDTSNNKLILMLMSPVEKIAEKVVLALIKGKKTKVTGFDGKLMCFLGKRFPHFTSSVMAKVLKISKQPIFDNLFED